MYYNYREAVSNDIAEYINENINFEDFANLEELEEHLYDTLWACDSVTGNASGSYTFNSYEAEEYICHNLELLANALAEFGCGLDYLLKNGAESADVTIRCYLLGECISEAMDEIKEAFEQAHAEMEEM